MDCSLDILLPGLKIAIDTKPPIDMISLLGSGVVYKTNVSIVGWILVDTIILVWSSAIPIVVTRLTILGEATVRGVQITPVQVLDTPNNIVSIVGIKALDTRMGMFNHLTLGLVVINVIHTSGIRL
jgi:hypothetical protein